MAAYSRVYDSRHLQADCQEPGSAQEIEYGQPGLRSAMKYGQPFQTVILSTFAQTIHLS